MSVNLCQAPDSTHILNSDGTKMYEHLAEKDLQYVGDLPPDIGSVTLSKCLESC